MHLALRRQDVLIDDFEIKVSLLFFIFPSLEFYKLEWLRASVSEVMSRQLLKGINTNGNYLKLEIQSASENSAANYQPS